MNSFPAINRLIRYAAGSYSDAPVRIKAIRIEVVLTRCCIVWVEVYKKHHCIAPTQFWWRFLRGRSSRRGRYTTEKLGLAINYKWVHRVHIAYAAITLHGKFFFVPLCMPHLYGYAAIRKEHFHKSTIVSHPPFIASHLQPHELPKLNSRNYATSECEETILVKQLTMIICFTALLVKR